METKDPIISQTLAHLFPDANGVKASTPVYTPTGDIQPIRILFLDVDGVLNSHKTQVVFGTIAFPGSDFDSGYVDNAHATDFLAAALINKVCEATGAYIVISSSWRIGSTLSQLRMMMEKLGINPKLIIGKTDQMGTEFGRGDQIERFVMNMNSVEGREHLVKCQLLHSEVKFAERTYVESYAIVDDDSDMKENQKARFVKTTFMEGLTCALAIELGKILSGDETFYLNQLSGRPSAGAEGEAKFH